MLHKTLFVGDICGYIILQNLSLTLEFKIKYIFHLINYIHVEIDKMGILFNLLWEKSRFS